MDSTRKLYRSKNRWLAGVCGGIGEYLNLDPIIIRVIWVIFSLFYGIGVLAYILAWLLIPMNPN
ncbi:MAG: PspC domain-containing protein [Candidatus Bathyarchaeia archaeon]